MKTTQQCRENLTKFRKGVESKKIIITLCGPVVFTIALSLIISSLNEYGRIIKKRSE